MCSIVRLAKVEGMAEIAFKFWHEKEQSAAVSLKGSRTPPPIRAKPKLIPQKSAFVDLDSGRAPWRSLDAGSEALAPRRRQIKPGGRPTSINVNPNMTLPPSNYNVNGDTMDRVPSSAPPTTIAATFLTNGIASSPGTGLVKTGTSTRRSLLLDDHNAPPAPPERPPPPKRSSLSEAKQEEGPPRRRITPDRPASVQQQQQPADCPRKSSRDLVEGFQDDMSLSSSSSSSSSPSLSEARAASLTSTRHPRFPPLPRSQTVSRDRRSTGSGDDTCGKTTSRKKLSSGSKSESFVSYVDEVDKGEDCNGSAEVGLVLWS